MSDGALVLRTLTPADEDQAVRAHEELRGDDFEFIFGLDEWPFTKCLKTLAREHAGVSLPVGRVPATFLGAFVDGDLVGRVSIRHELNDYLLAYGGHVGYAVRPAFRRQGYGTQILQQSLVVLRGLGVASALATTEERNVGSRTVIERCGGVLENVLPARDGGGATCRYWVSTAAAP